MRNLWIALVLALSAVAGWSPTVAARVLLYRGAHVYIVPESLSSEMLALAPREAWQHFPGLTRTIDHNDDQENDYIAIALGAPGGYGVQLRYRLNYRDGSATEQLGSWYWCVITGQDGTKVFEAFNL